RARLCRDQPSGAVEAQDTGGFLGTDPELCAEDCVEMSSAPSDLIGHERDRQAAVAGRYLLQASSSSGRGPAEPRGGAGRGPASAAVRSRTSSTALNRASQVSAEFTRSWSSAAMVRETSTRS